MSQSAQAPQSAGTPGTPGPPDARSRVTAAVAAASVDPGRAGGGTAKAVDTPALLNRWQVIAVTACLLFAIVTAVLQVLSWHANRAAADNTEQLVRVQNIQSSLLRADSLATSAFLIGGLEPPSQRAAYDRAIDDVTAQIAEAADAQPADGKALAALNTAVNGYAGTNTQARDNNRQGFPVGSAYLSTASSNLRTQALPIVNNLVTANADRAEGEMGAQRPWWLVLPGLLALAVLWWVNAQLAKTFRRRFNVGLLAAFLAIGVLTLLALGVSVTQRSHNNALRDGSYRVATDEAFARSAANDARANEALGRINRGSGAPFDAAYDEAAKRVTSHAERTTLDLWTAYDDLHLQVIALDDGGDWDGAVALITTLDPDGSTAAFDTFDAAAEKVVSDRADDTTRDLRSGNSGILVLAFVTLLVGLVAAAASSRGIAARRKEFA